MLNNPTRGVELAVECGVRNAADFATFGNGKLFAVHLPDDFFDDGGGSSIEGTSGRG